LATSLGLRITEAGRIGIADDRTARTAYVHHSTVSAAVVALAVAAPGLVERRADMQRLRLVDIVLKRSLMDITEIELLALACGLDMSISADRSADQQRFIDHLEEMVRVFSLSAFFQHGREACSGITLKPAAFDDVSGAVNAVEMKRWRAGFRKLTPEQQMVCATIVWLYRMEEDKTWLSRLPVRWSALHAINALREAGRLADWGKLVALYPGW
jgi:hypothetical protein